MAEMMALRGTLQGHSGWVTQIATTPLFPDMILSASRDKSLIVWKLTRDETNYGIPERSLRGHSHFVSDVVMSSDGQFALSGSWDHTLRLWDLTRKMCGCMFGGCPMPWGSFHKAILAYIERNYHGKQYLQYWSPCCASTKRFVGHTKDVLSVAFSGDNRQIVSGSRDKTIKLWNTLGVPKYTIQDDCHSEWVSCVRFSPNSSNPIIVSCGWDRLVKVVGRELADALVFRAKGHQEIDLLWCPCILPCPILCVASAVKDGFLHPKAIDWHCVKPQSDNKQSQIHLQVWNLTNCRLKTNHFGHTGYLNVVTVSPDGSLCASGGKDGRAMLWDLNEGKHLYTLEGGEMINSLCFSPNRYWLCAATGPTIKIWDLEAKLVVDELRLDVLTTGTKPPQCTCLAWSSDGQTLFAGYTDNLIRVWQVSMSTQAR